MSRLIMGDCEYAIFRCTVCGLIQSKITKGKWQFWLDDLDYKNWYFISNEYGRLDRKGNYKNPLPFQCLQCKEKGLKEVDDR